MVKFDRLLAFIRYLAFLDMLNSMPHENITFLAIEN
jgi:hypothetical protein